MDEQFANPSGSKLLEEVGAVFRTKPLFQKKTRHIMFVCGGKVDGSKPTMRHEFVNWARTELPDFILILAEAAFREALLHDPPRFVNLSKFEHLVAQISDCVLIFPESDGSFAEVGYFSSVDSVRRKVLVASDVSHQADSFLNLGPIDTFNKKSFLQPAVHVTAAGTGVDFRPVKERLARLSNRSRRRRLHHGPYSGLDYGEKFCVLLETIIIFRALTLEGLTRSIAESFGGRVMPADKRDFKVLLSTLIASGHVARCDDYFVPTASAAPLLDIEDTNLDDLVAHATYYHKRHDDRAYELIRGSTK
jgi:hypothetical protein